MFAESSSPMPRSATRDVLGQRDGGGVTRVPLGTRVLAESRHYQIQIDAPHSSFRTVAGQLETRSKIPPAGQTLPPNPASARTSKSEKEVERH